MCGAFVFGNFICNFFVKDLNMVLNSVIIYLFIGEQFIHEQF